MDRTISFEKQFFLNLDSARELRRRRLLKLEDNGKHAARKQLQYRKTCEMSYHSLSRSSSAVAIFPTNLQNFHLQNLQLRVGKWCFVKGWNKGVEVAFLGLTRHDRGYLLGGPPEAKQRRFRLRSNFGPQASHLQLMAQLSACFTALLKMGYAQASSLQKVCLA